jgi:cation diffusion facilitator CzcD-associated flavoprotein CzcO
MAVSKHVDVLIVGAGISGIGAAFRLQERCPDKSWMILEARNRVGGTWDLFRYPGVRSDSDMYTLGFPFRPWRSDVAIVSGDAIRDYIEDTAREFDIFDKIRFGHRVTRASWSSKHARWTVETDHEAFTCSFLYLGSGYYDYAQGYRPTWPHEDRFTGRIVHPQAWPEDLDYAGKRIAVIGSGATAVTLVPSLAEKAVHVTLVQRTPSYIAARPAKDSVAGWLQRRLPRGIADPLVRWKNILLTIFLYGRARKKPQRMADWLKEQIRKQLPPGYPVERDFSPPYDPWDQRLCLVPDADLFAAMRSGKVSIATGAIERFTPDGLQLATDEEVTADVIVTATGLNARLLGGIRVEVDGEPIDAAGRVVWKGMMLSGVPNLAFSFGYTNASWTLRSDLTARTFCRLLHFMDRKRFKICTPQPGAGLATRPFTEFSSGYIRRVLATLPRQGDRRPWRLEQNYVTDAAALRLGRVDAGLDLA